MIRSILVPLDGSRCAERALPTASAVARRTGACLRLARVHVPLPIGMVPGREAVLDAELHRAEGAYLREQVRRLACWDLLAEGVVLGGSVPFALRMAARSCPDGIVILAAHRRPPFERLLYGSIADGLVRRSGVPVLLVGGTEANSREVNRVFVPLDDSADAEAAVASAFDVAGPVEYVLVHFNGASGDLTTIPRLPGTATGTGTGADASFERARDFLAGRGAAVSVQVVCGRRSTSAIVELARNSDMIAMPRHRYRLGQLLFGSTTDQVSRRAPDVAMLICRGRARPRLPRRAPEFSSRRR